MLSKQIACHVNQNTVEIIDNKQTNAMEMLQIANKHLIEKMNHFNTIANVIYCTKSDLSANNLKVIKKCNTAFETEIHEALLIKKFNPILNRQLYSSGSSFLSNVY